MKKELLFVSLFFVLCNVFSTPIQLNIKSLGGEYIAIPLAEKGAIPVIAGESYMLKLQGEYINKIMSLFPNTEKEKNIVPTNIHFIAITIPKEAKRGNTYCITVCVVAGRPKTFCFEVVTKGKIEEIKYVAEEMPKHLGGIDRVNANKIYSIHFTGKEMEKAKLNVAQFPSSLTGTFISLVEQQLGYNSNGLLLQFRAQKGKEKLPTSLLAQLNQIGIIDQNADMDVPWIRYTIGTGDMANSKLPVSASAHLSDLNRLQLD